MSCSQGNKGECLRGDGDCDRTIGLVQIRIMNEVSVGS